jgi:protein-S-isoprenylcysteine O-methyltransferase Ste14
MNENRDVAGVRVPPPVIFFATLGVGLAAHFTLPGGWEIPLVYRLASAALFALPAGVVAAGAFFGMHRKHTPFSPDKPTTAVCCEGVYRITRNPMYLALVLLLAGIGCLMASPYLVLLSPVLLILYDRMAVRPEEAYLERKFGEDYLSYKQKVRRWL